MNLHVSTYTANQMLSHRGQGRAKGLECAGEAAQRSATRSTRMAVGARSSAPSSPPIGRLGRTLPLDPQCVMVTFIFVVDQRVLRLLAIE